MAAPVGTVHATLHFELKEQRAVEDVLRARISGRDLKPVHSQAYAYDLVSRQVKSTGVERLVLANTNFLLIYFGCKHR